MIPELWQHQRACLAASCDMPAAAIHWEPRLGKSRVVIETAAYLADRGEIVAAIVVAPNGVHLNWTRDQLPLYWDRPDTFVVEWRSSRVGTKTFERELERAVRHDGFVWLSANVEALRAPAKRSKGSPLFRYLERFVRDRRALLAVDESHYVKNPKARRTRALLRIAPRCPYRRTLTGTPTPQGPFDLWSQFQLLDPEILDGLRFYPFKQRYGVWRRVQYGAGGKPFDELVEYRNLDELASRIAPYTFEGRKDDEFDLPDRVFARRYFEMPDAHARVYRKLRDETIAWLASGETISAPLAIVRLMRLQQVSRGHVSDDAGDPVDLGGPYPADDAVIELVEKEIARDGKAVVWCRFRHDVARLETAFSDAGIVAVRCDGDTPQIERPELIRRFREDPAVRVWVGTPATGGLGIDLGAAGLMVFHSHGFDLAQRLQALERNYGTSQGAERVDVVDLVAADTVDERALVVLDRKQALARSLTSEGLREMLR